MTVYLTLIAGLLLLIAGGEGLIRGAVALAERLGLSKAFVGIVVIGFGTSLPELLVSVRAATVGVPGIALGNVVGSNIANVLLILGIAALIRPQRVTGQVLRRDGSFLGVATLVMTAALLWLPLGALAGALMIGAFALFIGHCYRTEQVVAHDSDDPPLPEADGARKLAIAILMSAAGIVGLAYGAALFVESATTLAEDFGVPEAIVGLSVVAVGTSLPELVAAIVAAYRRQTELVVGNIIGSNLFNLLLILGATLLITPITAADVGVRVDLVIMLGATALLMVGLITRRRLERWEGAVFLALYAGYCVRLAGG